MYITLIQGGDVYSPAYLGRQSMLLVDGTIARIGQIDAAQLRALPLDVHIVDASGCLVIPGLIDPHIHLIGGGGESGFASRTPEIRLSDIVRSGVTTVVGCLGTDGTTRHLTSLLAKARALEEEGISAYIYTGNYQVPPPTMTVSVRDDLIIVDKVVGVGEIAIADRRSAQPSLHEVAKLVAEASVGGVLSGKAGVTHFHIGSGKHRLALLHALLDQYEIAPENVYATHINRGEALMDDAIALSKKGAFVDIDTTEGGLARWLTYYREHGGVAGQLTISSDGNGSLPQMSEDGRIMGVEMTRPGMLYEQFVESIVEHGLLLQDVLPHLTSNTATVLKLEKKGRLQEQMDADVLVLRKGTLEIVDLFARGRRMIEHGDIVVKGTFE